MTRALLRRCEGYLDVAPAHTADIVDVGPLRVFVSRAPFPYYARPRPGANLTAVGSVTAEHVRTAAAVLADAGRPISFEWIDELAPALRDVLRDQGFAVTRHPLLVRHLRGNALRGVAPALAARLLGAESPDLRDALAVQRIGFGSPGTALGDAGASERDADTVGDDFVAYVRERIRAGRSAVAVADDPEAGVVACGWHQRVGHETEVVGVATLPAHRRRGAAAAVLDVLIADATAHGVTMALLSAEDDAVARIYEMSGFTRVGHTGAAEPIA